MKTSLDLHVINTTLRIAMHCHAFNLWLEPDSSGTEVAWHGDPAWDFANMKSRIGLEYEVKTELPEQEGGLYPEIMALKRNVADICIDIWGVTYERSKHIDFSYPDLFAPIHIFSGKTNTAMQSNLVTVVFDNLSYMCLVTAFALMCLVSRLLQAQEHQKGSLFTCMLYVFGNAMNQPLQPPLIRKNLFGRIIMTLFGLYNNLMCLMYGSIIISFLISNSNPQEINSLEDLHKTEHINMRIVMIDRSFVLDFLKNANMLSGLEHRIDYIDYTDRSKPSTFERILQGSHVLIAATVNIKSWLCKANRVANYTIANLEDLVMSR